MSLRRVLFRSTPTCVGTTITLGQRRAQLSGSPPRAWGRRRRRRPGNRRSPVHPHVRGDDTSSKRVNASSNGSPPRAWGRRHESRRRRRWFRFTPTCVGTTDTRATPHPTTSVHPHVRGDDCGGRCKRPPCVGSPPRAWGRRSRTASKAPLMPVHPHVRGDDDHDD